MVRRYAYWVNVMLIKSLVLISHGTALANINKLSKVMDMWKIMKICRSGQIVFKALWRLWTIFFHGLDVLQPYKSNKIWSVISWWSTQRHVVSHAVMFCWSDMRLC